VYGSDQLAQIDLPRSAGLRRADTVGGGQYLDGWRSKRSMVCALCYSHVLHCLIQYYPMVCSTNVARPRTVVSTCIINNPETTRLPSPGLLKIYREPRQIKHVPNLPVDELSRLTLETSTTLQAGILVMLRLLLWNRHMI
jgi:hypothetical protein